MSLELCAQIYLKKRSQVIKLHRILFLINFIKNISKLESKIRLENLLPLRLSKTSIIIAFWSAFTFALHLVIANNFELHRDELLFVALGKHLDWGYASVPPIIGLLSGIAQLLFSDVQFGLKFLAALTGGGLVIVVGNITTILGGKNWAIFLKGYLVKA